MTDNFQYIIDPPLLDGIVNSAPFTLAHDPRPDRGEAINWAENQRLDQDRLSYLAKKGKSDGLDIWNGRLPPDSHKDGNREKVKWEELKRLDAERLRFIESGETLENDTTSSSLIQEKTTEIIQPPVELNPQVISADTSDAALVDEIDFEDKKFVPHIVPIPHISGKKRKKTISKAKRAKDYSPRETRDAETRQAKRVKLVKPNDIKVNTIDLNDENVIEAIRLQNELDEEVEIQELTGRDVIDLIDSPSTSPRRKVNDRETKMKFNRDIEIINLSDEEEQQTITQEVVVLSDDEDDTDSVNIKNLLEIVDLPANQYVID